MKNRENKRQKNLIQHKQGIIALTVHQLFFFISTPFLKNLIQKQADPFFKFKFY
jgi:hypothetical protein